MLWDKMTDSELYIPPSTSFVALLWLEIRSLTHATLIYMKAPD